MKKYDKKLYVFTALAFAAAWFVLSVVIAAGIWL